MLNHAKTITVHLLNARIQEYCRQCYKLKQIMMISKVKMFWKCFNWNLGLDYEEATKTKTCLISILHEIYQQENTPIQVQFICVNYNRCFDDNEKLFIDLQFACSSWANLDVCCCTCRSSSIKHIITVSHCVNKLSAPLSHSAGGKKDKVTCRLELKHSEGTRFFPFCRISFIVVAE